MMRQPLSSFHRVVVSGLFFTSMMLVAGCSQRDRVFDGPEDQAAFDIHPQVRFDVKRALADAIKKRDFRFMAGLWYYAPHAAKPQVHADVWVNPEWIKKYGSKLINNQKAYIFGMRRGNADDEVELAQVASRYNNKLIAYLKDKQRIVTARPCAWPR